MNKRLRSDLRKFNRKFRLAKRSIRENASIEHISVKEYTRLCKNSWMTLILYHSNTFPAALLYAYEYYLKKYNYYGY